MRSNLLSLQSTGRLLDRTQTRLSTGKKVNTAIDNPVSYFAAQSLTSRASVIDSLKDAMGQAVSTINAADKGITALTSMIEQAKGIAQSAQSADNAQNTVTLDLNTVVAGNTLGLGDSGLTLTATASAATSVQFNVGSSDTETAANVAAAINAYTYAGTASYSASSDGDKIIITKYTRSTGRETNMATGDVTGSATLITGATVTTASESELESLITQYDTLRSQLTELAEDSGYKGKNLLSATSALRSMTVKFEGTTLTVQGFNATAAGLGITSASGTGSAATTTTGTVSTVLTGLIGGSISRSGETGVFINGDSLDSATGADMNANPQNYRMVDSATGGTGGMATGNIGPRDIYFYAAGPYLVAMQTISGSFNTGDAVTVQYCASGFDQTTGAPNAMSAPAPATSGGWLDPAAIETALNELDSALITLRKESSRMSANLGIITTRQDFSTDMMNTLTEGADKLTLADTNEEGANMLMLQTRQSLGITALSMSAQASQAVLQLFG